MLLELLAADIERIEGIGAVGTVFEKVFFGLRCFSIDLFLRKPLRPCSTPADWMARIRSSLFCRLKYGIRRCFPTKPWLRLCQSSFLLYTHNTQADINNVTYRLLR